MKFKLTKAGFLRWLDAQPDNKRAKCGDMNKCILAEYAADMTGRTVQVDGDELIIFKEGVTVQATNKAIDEDPWGNRLEDLVESHQPHQLWAQNVVTVFDRFERGQTPDGKKAAKQPTLGRVRESIKAAANHRGGISLWD